MIRLTRQTDLGVLLMTTLARRAGERPRTAKDLAMDLGVPLPTTSKVLKVLARSGLLASVRGQKGGYLLSRSADEITVVDMITALEGPIALTVCSEEASSCDQEPRCPVHGHWLVINQVVRDALAGITLRHMATPGNPLFATLRWRSEDPGTRAAAGSGAAH